MGVCSKTNVHDRIAARVLFIKQRTGCQAEPSWPPLWVCLTVCPLWWPCSPWIHHHCHGTCCEGPRPHSGPRHWTCTSVWLWGKRKWTIICTFSLEWKSIGLVWKLMWHHQIRCCEFKFKCLSPFNVSIPIKMTVICTAVFFSIYLVFLWAWLF